MSEVATIDVTLPRLEGESARAYSARVRYVTMGPQRSIDKVGQQLGYKSARPPGHLTRWSQQFDWVGSARAYDEQVAFLSTRRAAQRYLDDLEEHRERYQRSGKALHGVAVEMLTRLRSSSTSIEYTPAALSTIARALTVAADLEAHALRVADLLPRLTDDQPDQ